MNSLGDLTERDFQSLVVAGYKTLPYEGFTLKEPLITSGEESTKLPEGLYLLDIRSEESGINAYLFMEGMFRPLSGGTLVKASDGSVIDRWNQANNYRMVKSVPMKTYPLQYGQSVVADGFTITMPTEGEVACKVLMMVCKEWDILQWELGNG